MCYTDLLCGARLSLSGRGRVIEKNNLAYLGFPSGKLYAGLSLTKASYFIPYAGPKKVP